MSRFLYFGLTLGILENTFEFVLIATAIEGKTSLSNFFH